MTVLILTCLINVSISVFNILPNLNDDIMDMAILLILMRFSWRSMISSNIYVVRWVMIIAV